MPVTSDSRRREAGGRVRSRGWRLAGHLGVGAALLFGGWSAVAQQRAKPEGPAEKTTVFRRLHEAGTAAFLRGRTGGAEGMERARRQHAAMLAGQANGGGSLLGAKWTSLGPGQVTTPAYGAVTGRVTAVAIDPADGSGNTVYLGTTGGGVWKSIHAAGAAEAVVFTPLTDTLPVYSANAGTAVVPSLSIGAVLVAGGVVLAGTGDPNDATDSYYGSGLLRSADGGVTWTLVQGSRDGVAGNHSFVGLSFAGLAASGLDAKVMVAAVSQAVEGDLVNAADATNSVKGLYYSADGGLTWQMSDIVDGAQTVQTPLPSGGNHGGNAATAVVWNGARQRFYAAVRYHGYYESTDGATWTRLLHQPGAGLTAAACPASPGTTGSLGCPLFRGALAVQTVTGDTFALTVDGANLDQGVWQDVCALSGSGCGNAMVTFGKQLGTAALEQRPGDKTIAQGDYNLALLALPHGSGASADTLLFAGTADLYRCSLAQGCSFRNTTNALNGCGAPAKVAPGQHALAGLSGGLVYVGNDGGIWRSVDGVDEQGTVCSADDATHFQNLNGGLGSLSEVISFAQDPAARGTLLAGLGANGAAGTGDSAGGPWPQLSAGEGGTVAIDQANPANWYVTTGAGVSLRYCAKGTACTAADFAGVPTVGMAQVGGDGSVLDPPWILDPAAATQVLIGTCRVWRGPARDGAAWSGANAISRAFDGSAAGTCGLNDGFVRSLAAGGSASGAVVAQNAGSTLLYAGMAGSLDGGANVAGHVFQTTTAGTATSTTVWTDVAKSPVTNDAADQGVFNPGGFDVSSLAADAHDATGRTVYATVMGFAGNGVNAPHVYRTIDAGAHWTNISSNLPNAPANSVVVDPNDANTLYVALDTGVYVTTQVAGCLSGNCWSVYGSGLPNAPVVVLEAGAGLPTGDGRSGELRAATYGRGIWELPLLTAASSLKPAIGLTPGSLTFSAQAVGSASAGQTVTVTNTGDAALVVSRVGLTGDFISTDTCVAAAVAPGGSCAVQVSFLPTATGARSGTLTVYGNVSGGQAMAALAGTGEPGAAIVLSPVNLSFAVTPVGAASAAQNVTISNTGAVTTALGGVLTTGDYRISANTCGASLGPGVGCTVSVVFQPTASGTRTGTLTVTDDAGTQTASLTGVGIAAATDSLGPGSLSFGLQALHTASAAQQVTLTNAGDVALTLIAGQITSGDFTVVNGCGNSLNAHASCTLNVAFAPKSVGAGVGVLTVSDQYRTQAVALNGVGVAPAGVSLTPFAGLMFAPTGVGLSAAAQTVTLANNGGLALTIQGVAVLGEFSVVAGSNGCSGVLAAQTACTLQVAFAPQGPGARAGTLVLTDDAAGSPQQMTLAGTGVDFVLAANGPTTVTVTSGTSAVFPLLLSSVASVPGTAVFSCSGAPAHALCGVSPTTAGLGGATTISVTVQTGVAGVAGLGWGGTARGWLWALLLPVGWLGLRGRRRWVLGLVLLVGCGTPRLVPDAGGTGSGGGAVSPTPPGSYAMVVTATSAGLVRMVGLTLVVQ